MLSYAVPSSIFPLLAVPLDDMLVTMVAVAVVVVVEVVVIVMVIIIVITLLIFIFSHKLNPNLIPPSAALPQSDRSLNYFLPAR